MNGSHIAEALREGQREYGTCVIALVPQWPSMIGRTALDFAFLDTEHIVLDQSRMAWRCQA